MKKTLLGVLFMLFSVFSFAQTLNYNANWPNTAWSLSGTFLPEGVINNPTVPLGSSNFTFDDSVLPLGTNSSIYLESPIIDLTSAFNAGEKIINISFKISYRVISTEILTVEFWDATNSIWNSGGNADVLDINNDYQSCTNLQSINFDIDISSYDANQLANYKLRFKYDDSGIDTYGVCVNDVILVSQTCSSPNHLNISNVSRYSVIINYDVNGNNENIIEFGKQGFTLGDGKQYTTNNKNYQLTSLQPGTNYDVYVKTTCEPNVYSAWSEVSNFTTDVSIINSPTNIATSNITTSSFDISWTEDTSVELWQIQIVEPGDFNESNSGFESLTNSFIANNLWYNQAYEVYVRGSNIAKDEYSAWVGPINVTTNDISHAISVGFNWPSTDWSLSGNYDIAGLLNNPTVNGGSTHFTFDDNVLLLGSNSNIFIESPVVDLTNAFIAGEFTLNINFHISYRTELYESFNIDFYDADSGYWIPFISAPQNPGSNDYKNCSNMMTDAVIKIDISNFSASQLTGFKFRFNFDDRGLNAYGVCISNVSLQTTACNEPTNVTITDISKYKATLNFTHALSNEYIVEIGKQGFTKGEGNSIIRNINNSPFTFENLQPGTNYDLYIKSVCDDNLGIYSNDVKVQFTTSDAIVSQPTNIVVGTITDSTIDITWDSDPSVTEWQVYILKDGDNTFEVINTIQKSFTFIYLEYNTDYRIRVRGIANNPPNFDYSSWVGSEVIKTLDIPHTIQGGFTWPSLDWTLEGTYDPLGLTNNPRIVDKFSFDDDILGPNSINNIFAISPKLDLRTAVSNNEIIFNLKFDISYRAVSNEVFSFEYWDEDADSWNEIVAAPSNIGISDSGFIDNSYKICDYQFKNVGISLNIGDFTQNQLENFKIGIRFDDNGIQSYGFCINDMRYETIGCSTPTNPTTSEISYTSAIINYSSPDSWQTDFLARLTRLDGENEIEEGEIYSHGTTLYLSNLEQSTTYRVYIRAKCGDDSFSSWSNYLEFTTLTCTPPSDFTANSVGYSSIDLSWTINGTETNWTIQYGIAPIIQGPDNSFMQTNSNPVTLINLQPNTTYGIFIKSDCFENSNDWVGPIEITTQACVEPTNILVDPSYSSATISWNSGGLETAWEIEGGPQGFEIGNGIRYTSNLNSFEIENIYGLLTPGNLYDVYVRAKCDIQTSSNWVGPITFETLSCDSPTFNNLEVENITFDSVDLSWETGNIETLWDLKYGEENFDLATEGNIIGGLTSSSFTINGLQYNTSYQVYVRAFCELNGYSDWEGPLDFNTLSCDPPQNALNIVEITNTTATLNWLPEGYEVGWYLQWGLEGFEINGLGSNVDYIIYSDNPEFEITNLLPDTSYDVYIQSKCNESANSSWSSNPFQFTTSNTLSLSENVLEGFKFYPNPAKNMVELSALNNIQKITIYSVLGKEIKSIKPDANRYMLDLSDSSSGIYFIKVQIAEKIGVYKIIKD
jgi:hypothetical protein